MPIDYSLYTNEEQDPQEGFVLKKARAKSKGGTLTDAVQPGQSVLPAARAALTGTTDPRARAAELFQQGSDMFNAEPDMSQLQGYARTRGQESNTAMLAALAAQLGGESYAPLQQHFLKKSMSASEPIKVSGGMLTPDGQFIKDPGAAQEKKAEFLLQQARAYEQMAQTADTARERLAAKRESEAMMQQLRLMGLQIQGMNAQTARMNANGAQMKPPSGYRFTPEGDLQAIPGGPADTKIQGAYNADTAALQSSSSALDRLEAAANEVQNHPGLPSVTGLRGAIPNIPGTKAADAEAKLEQLRGQAGFAVLQAMRDASKSGGALGQVSNFELQALQNNLAALQKAQSIEQIKTELTKIQDFAQGAKGRLRDAYNMKHGDKSPAPSTAPAGGGNLSAQEQAELEALRKRFGGR